jgi:hypothetical protein
MLERACYLRDALGAGASAPSTFPVTGFLTKLLRTLIRADLAKTSTSGQLIRSGHIAFDISVYYHLRPRAEQGTTYEHYRQGQSENQFFIHFNLLKIKIAILLVSTTT